METRRVQRTGGSSFVLTLPKKWIKAHQLKAKAPLSVHQQASGALLVQLPRATAARRHTIKIDNLIKDSLTRETLAYYLAGADELEFTSRNLTRAQRSHIRQLIQGLVGFEVIDESAARLLAKNVFDISKLSIPQTIEKMSQIANSMVHDALSTAASRATLTDLINRDQEIDRLFLMVKRQFNAMLSDTISEHDTGLTRNDASYYETIALRLERIADHAVLIAQIIKRAPAKQQLLLARRYRAVAAQIQQTLQNSWPMVHQCDKQAAHRMLTACTALQGKISRLNLSSSEEAIIAKSFDLFCSNLNRMAEATIDHAVHRATTA